MDGAPHPRASHQTRIDQLRFKHNLINNVLYITNLITSFSSVACSHHLQQVMATGQGLMAIQLGCAGLRRRGTNILREHLRLKILIPLTCSLSFEPQMRRELDL